MNHTTYHPVYSRDKDGERLKHYWLLVTVCPNGKRTERNWASEKESGLGKNELNNLPQTSLIFWLTFAGVLHDVGPGLDHQYQKMGIVKHTLNPRFSMK